MPQMVSRGLASTRVVPLVAISDARSAGFCVNCAVTLIWVWARNYYLYTYLGFIGLAYNRQALFSPSYFVEPSHFPSQCFMFARVIGFHYSLSYFFVVKKTCSKWLCLTQRCILHHAPFPGSYVLSGASYIARRSRIPHQLP